MDLELSDEQQELEHVARGLLDRHAPIAQARAWLDGGGDPAPLWSAIAEGGWYAIGLDDDDPFGLPGLCILAREAGAHVAATVLVDTAIATRLLPEAADSGATALAALEPGSDWGLETLETAAAARGDGFVVSGVKVGVPHADRSDALLVLADAGGEVAAVLVDPSAPGVTVAPEPALDPSARPCRVTLEEAAGRGAVVPAPQLSRALAIGAVAAAAEGVGAASRALDLAVDYAREREQFGRPIGRFQAVQHLLADAHVLRETAWSTVLYAAAALEERAPGDEAAAAIAKAHGARAAREVVETALQVFGGVAFTWEHDVHLFQRRVLDLERRFGDGEHHEVRIGDGLAARGMEVLS